MFYQILIVDDDRNFRGGLRRILEDRYEVLEAGDGAAALRKMKAPNLIGLILLDVKLPGARGTEVLKQIRQVEPEVFVIMLAGFSEREVIIESLRGHADDFIEKPVNIAKLFRVINGLLGRAQPESIKLEDKLRWFVEKNFHKDISLEDAADAVSLSAKYVSRVFKRDLGIGFNRYKINLRMKKSLEFLRNSVLNINEIAYKIGYKNVESYVRIFKRVYGCTPSEFRLKEAESRRCFFSPGPAGVTPPSDGRL